MAIRSIMINGDTMADGQVVQPILVQVEDGNYYLSQIHVDPELAVGIVGMSRAQVEKVRDALGKILEEKAP